MTQYKFYEEKEMRRMHVYKDIPCNFVPNQNTQRRQIRNMDTGEVFDTLQLAADSVGKSIESIAAGCQKRLKTVGGYRWEYIGDIKNQVRCIGPGIVYDSIADAAREMAKQGASFEAAKAKIGRAVRGIIKTAYGYRWEKVK